MLKKCEIYLGVELIFAVLVLEVWWVLQWAVCCTTSTTSVCLHSWLQLFYLLVESPLTLSFLSHNRLVSQSPISSSSLPPISSSTTNGSSSPIKLSESYSSLANNVNNNQEINKDINKINDNYQFDPLAYFKFIFKPNLILISSLGIIVAAQITFFDLCLSL